MLKSATESTLTVCFTPLANGVNVDIFIDNSCSISECGAVNSRLPCFLGFFFFPIYIILFFIFNLPVGCVRCARGGARVSVRVQSAVHVAGCEEKRRLIQASNSGRRV